MKLPKTVDPETADTDEMIEILRTRFDRMLFVGIRALDEKRYNAKIRFKDLPVDGLGLAQYAYMHIAHDIDSLEVEETDLEDPAD